MVELHAQTLVSSKKQNNCMTTWLEAVMQCPLHALMCCACSNMCGTLGHIASVAEDGLVRSWVDVVASTSIINLHVAGSALREGGWGKSSGGNARGGHAERVQCVARAGGREHGVAWATPCCLDRPS